MIKRKSLFQVLGIFISLLVAGLYVISFLAKDFLKNVVAQEIGTYGLLFIFALAALLDFIPQYIAPHVVLLNIALGFSLYSVLIVAILGSTFGAVLGFLVGRRYGLYLVKDLINNKKIERVELWFDSHGKWFVTLAAVSPLPYLPFAFGSLGMKWKNFALFGLLPRAISFVLVAYAGVLLSPLL